MAGRLSGFARFPAFLHRSLRAVWSAGEVLPFRVKIARTHAFRHKNGFLAGSLQPWRCGLDLDHFSDETLQAELARRAGVAAESARAEREAANRKVLENRDVLLGLMTHDRNTCSDEHTNNGYSTSGRGGQPRCAKCFLMWLGESDLGLVKIEVTVRGGYLEGHPQYEG